MYIQGHIPGEGGTTRTQHCQSDAGKTCHHECWARATDAASSPHAAPAAPRACLCCQRACARHSYGYSLCVCVCVCARARAGVCARMHVCVFVCVNVYIYIYTHTCTCTTHTCTHRRGGVKVNLLMLVDRSQACHIITLSLTILLLIHLRRSQVLAPLPRRMPRALVLGDTLARLTRR